MKILIGVTCVAIVIAIGQQFWSIHHDDRFQVDRAEMVASEAAGKK